MSFIPCFDKKKGAISSIQLKELAKELGIVVAKNTSKRELCEIINKISDKTKIKTALSALDLTIENYSAPPPPPKKIDETPTKIVEQKNIVHSENLQRGKILENNPKLANAILSGNINSVKEVLQNNRNGATDAEIFTFVYENSTAQMLEFFLKNVISSSKSPSQLAFIAVYYNNKDILKYYLDNGADPNFTYETTPILFEAIRKRSDGKFRDVELLELLFQYGADVNTASKAGKSALIFAIGGQNVAAVKILLQKCAKFTEYKDLTVLDYAVTTTKEIFRFVLEYIDNQKCQINNFPLVKILKHIDFIVTQAMHEKFYHVTFLLLSRWKDYSIPNQSLSYCLDIALIDDAKMIVDLYINSKPTMIDFSVANIYLAALVTSAIERNSNDEFSDIKVLKWLINNGANINVPIPLQDSDETTSSLAVAIEADNQEAAKILLENCVELKEKEGLSIVEFARKEKRFEIAQMILQHELEKTCKKFASNDVAKIVFPVVPQDDGADDTSGTFIGSDINDMAAMLYFVKNFKDACFPTIFQLQYNTDKSTVITVPNDFMDNFKICQKQGNVRFIVGSIVLTNLKTGHANVFVADLKNGIKDEKKIVIEIYEPHGKVDDKFFDQKKYRTELANLFKNRLAANELIYIGDVCPFVSLQGWQGSEVGERKKFDPEGFCAAWSLWWIHYRLQNPLYSREVLAQHANSELLKGKKELSLTKMIRNYANFILKQRNTVIHNMCNTVPALFEKYQQMRNAELRDDEKFMKLLELRDKRLNEIGADKRKNDEKLRRLEMQMDIEEEEFEIQKHLYTRNKWSHLEDCIRSYFEFEFENLTGK